MGVLTLSTPLGAVLEHGGKTYLSLLQYDTRRCQEYGIWHTHTTTNIGNPLGLSVQVTPFFSTAVRTSQIAEHFTLKESESIKIASDRFNQKSDSVLPYHALVHNPAPDALEKSATINLTPTYTTIGSTLSLFYDAEHTAPGFSFQCQLPVYYVTAHLAQAGGTSTITQYFNGTYHQTTPQQDPLEYGLLGRHRYTVCGPLSVALKYNFIENEQNYITTYIGAGFALHKQPIQKYLFDFHSAVYSHHKLICGFEAGATLTHDEDFTLELLAQTHYHYFFAGEEHRILGLLDDDGSIPVHSSYLLGAESLKKGVFPLTNVLHRPVRRSGMHQLDVACIGALTYKNWTINLGYGIIGREQETITVQEWPHNRYAIVSPTYDTSDNFDNTTGETGELGEYELLLNHRFLTTDMINTTVAANPAQVTLSVSTDIGCTLELYGFPVGLGSGFSYEHGVTNGSISLITGWFKTFISF
jgi:hypothetical protein